MISMPLALAVGRRPVFLVSCIVQVVSLVCCATNTGYTGHFTARCILGLAAGQSEALCPLMISVSLLFAPFIRCLLFVQGDLFPARTC
jgi:predicted MFS family arabinose efflux permease